MGVGFFLEPPLSEPTFEGGENIFVQRATLADSILPTYLDPFTYNSLYYGGFYDFIKPYLPKQYIIESILVLYVSSVLFLSYLLHRILFILPGIFYMILVWYGFSESSMVCLLLLIIWLMNRITHLLSKKESKDVPFATAAFYPREKPEPWLKGSVHPLGLMIVILGVAIALGPEAYSTNLRGVFVIIAVLFGSVIVPGVGGHSTFGLLGIGALFLLALFIFPQVMGAVVDAIVFAIKPKEAPILDPIAQASRLLTPSSTDLPFTLAITTTNFSHYIRALVGFIFQWWCFYDDVLGPGAAIEEATRTKRKAPEQGKAIIASNFTSNWVMTNIVSLLYYIYTCSWTGLMVYLTAAMFTGIVWQLIGKKVWAGRGQAATNTEMRGSMMFSFGEGPSALRILILKFALGINLAQLGLVEYRSWLWAIIAVSYLFWRCDRTKTFMLGLTSMNLSLIYDAVMLRNPVNQSLEDNQEPAYTPVANFSSSSGEVPRQSTAVLQAQRREANGINIEPG